MPAQHPSIIAACAAHAAANPERPCLIWEGQTLSYGQLAGLASGYATRYRELGVTPGARVALFLPSSPSFVAAYLGAHAAGAAAVLVNTQYRQVELHHILGDSAPQLVVTDAAGAAELGGLLDELPEPARLLLLDPYQHEPWAIGTLAGPFPAPHELAVLAYTSGTTGRAKGAMLTHGSLAANSAAVAQAWRWTAADHLLLTLPLFHIHGLGVGLHGTLLAGASLELRPRFDAAEVLDSLASNTHTLFFGVPTLYTRLIAEAQSRLSDNQASPSGYRLSARALRAASPGYRLFVCGSAPLSPQTFAAFEELFGQRILERYGMTETGMNLTNPYDGERRPGSVGAPFLGQAARVVEPRTRAELPDGSVGEIEVRGPHVCAGYWRNPAATAEVFHADGWFSTGDLGWRSADGYYTLTGRAKELIISGGYNIYPRELEELLLEHPEVQECAVIGMPDPDFGEQVVAVIVPTNPAQPPTPEELAAFCRERLAAYKRPRAIYYVAALPRNALGKVEKHRLKGGL